MALVDVVEWSTKSNDVFAWRFPHSNLSTWTQLVVRESQEAVFFSKGKLMGKFGAGKHKLTTENLPALRTLYGIPFGGRNPFMAEVWFVNKAMPLNIDWRTTPVRINDPEYRTMVPIVASGRYGVQIEDAEKFLVKLVGTMESFNSRNLTDHFMGQLITKTNSVISSYMSSNGVGINQIGTQLDNLSTFLGQPMGEFWADYGLRLTGFYITSVDVDASSEEGRRIRKAISDRSEIGILGDAWQQQQAFNMANNALSHDGDMGILGVAMMTGLFQQGGGFGALFPQQQLGSRFNGIPQQDGVRGASWHEDGANVSPQKPKQVFCAQCGNMSSAVGQFCPTCGHKYNFCPVCGSDNLESAHRCVTCGYVFSTTKDAVLADTTCPYCNKPVSIGTKFCPYCGRPIN